MVMPGFETLIYNFFFCHLRLSGIFMLSPFFSVENFDDKAKIMMTYLVTLAVFLSMSASDMVMVSDDIQILSIGFKEFVVGAAIGLNIAIVTEVLHFFGTIVSVPMGLSIAQSVDPTTGEQGEIVGQFATTLGILIFLAINGHHYVLEAFAYSYKVIGLGDMMISQGKITFFIERYYKLFELAIKISMPIMAAMFLIQFSLGIIVRSMPKFNIFMIGIPIQIVLGIITFLITMPYMVKFIKTMYFESFQQIPLLMKILGA